MSSSVTINDRFYIALVDGLQPIMIQLCTKGTCKNEKIETVLFHT